jgi:hypothetical protein
MIFCGLDPRFAPPPTATPSLSEVIVSPFRAWLQFCPVAPDDETCFVAASRYSGDYQAVLLNATWPDGGPKDGGIGAGVEGLDSNLTPLCYHPCSGDRRRPGLHRFGKS